MTDKRIDFHEDLYLSFLFITDNYAILLCYEFCRVFVVGFKKQV